MTTGRAPRKNPKVEAAMSRTSPSPIAIEPVAGEPWVKLADGAALAHWTREDEIALNQANRQTEKYGFFVKAFDFLTENRVRGDYHEFGCHRCRTFRMALTEARRHNQDQMKFFAFDSFAGLPDAASDPSVELWKRGALATSEGEFMQMVREHGIYADRVVTIKGFYADSLTPALQRRFRDNENKIALVNIDCDLYESAVPVFDFIEPLLQEGSVLYIDDMFSGYKGSPAKGVARAFREFRARSRFKFVRHLDIGWWGRSYIAYIDPDGPAAEE
ncbi:MAG: class I SAM-dependent methyltransferase [Proteobacteria bacterium]|nr:class I SAM-dependent methyltransferase [Pseudomonadota bacterium]